jgi:hypothetical protein
VKSWTVSVIPYLLPVVTLVLGLLTLLKEWEEYKNPRLRIAVGCVLIIVGLLTIMSLYLDFEETRETAGTISRLEGQVKGLEGEVKAAHNAQKDNTQLFLESFKKLSAEVSNLQTQVKTEALQKKLATVESELQRTQKALAPGPKAVLVFSFFPFINPPAGSSAPVVPVTDIKLPVLADGSVHVEFTVLNLSDVDALDGSITLQICDDCKFAKEPAGFRKLAGQSDTQRYMEFKRILTRVSLETMTVDVTVPPRFDRFLVGIVYRCRTCVVTEKVSTGTVHLVR